MRTPQTERATCERHWGEAFERRTLLCCTGMDAHPRGGSPISCSKKTCSPSCSRRLNCREIASLPRNRRQQASSPPRAPPLRSARYFATGVPRNLPETPYAVRYGPRKMVETQVCSGALLERPRGCFGYGTPHAVGTPDTHRISWPEFLLNASRAQPQPHAESQRATLKLEIR